MHRQILNECRIRGTLRTTSPLLIRSAVETMSGADSGPVLTMRDGLDQPYLPGSSLKGALRGQAERLLRTLREDSACNPLDDRGPARACGRHFEEMARDQQRADRRQPLAPATLYRDACAACRTFGSPAFAGRVSVDDGYVVGTALPPLVRREGIGIDRFSGAASLRSRYDLEAVTDVTLSLSVTVRNFEVWQLGLVGLVVQELLAGRIPIGAGKSRGLGRVEGSLQYFDLAYIRTPRSASVQDEILGVGALIDDTGRFGYHADDRVPHNAAATVSEEGIWRLCQFAPEQEPWSVLGESFGQYLERDFRPSPWLSREGDGHGARLRHPGS